jgi:hypothetical protein
MHREVLYAIDVTGRMLLVGASICAQSSIHTGADCQNVSVGFPDNKSLYFAGSRALCRGLPQLNNCLCAGASNSTGFAHSASSFCTWLMRVLTGYRRIAPA